MSSILSSLRDVESSSTLDVRVPDRCPICHVHIRPEPKVAIHEKSHPDRAEVIFLCPSDDCRRLFVARYSRTRGTGQHSTWPLKELQPVRHAEREFESVINEVSPSFTQIYNEAKIAEELGLSQICGVGYRKSFEFLVKDFLKSVHPDKAKHIEQLSLGGKKGCIATLVDHPKLKTMAEKATWLGNDETHYTRIWQSKDLTHLKELIDISLHWIAMELKTAEYEAAWEREDASQVQG